MPGWGTGSFENDEAQNWLKQMKALSLNDLQQIFSGVDPVAYLEAPAASIVIAAAEVVAALKGAPPPRLPNEIVEWISQAHPASSELREVACQTVHHVRIHSELKDLWLEADGLNEWSASLRDLEQRLSG